MSQHHRSTSVYTAVCETCDVESELETPNDLVDFYHRHRRRTGHDVVLADVDLAFDLPAADDLETVVADLEDHYPDGVPVGIVAAAMSERGLTVGETIERIDSVRLTGALYEPRDDHLAAV